MGNEGLPVIKELEGQSVTFGIYSSDHEGYRNTTRLEPFRHQIEKVAHETIIQVGSEIPLKNVNISVFDCPSKVIPEYGIMGWAHGGSPVSEIEILLDPNSPVWSAAIGINLKRTLRHELFHDVRFDHFGGFPKNLAERIVSEGLATRYENQSPDLPPSLYATALTSEQTEEMMERIKQDLQSTHREINHAWIFGSRERNIPRWTGYSLGYKLVEEYLAKHPNLQPSDLYSVDTAEFIT